MSRFHHSPTRPALQNLHYRLFISAGGEVSEEGFACPLTNACLSNKAVGLELWTNVRFTVSLSGKAWLKGSSNPVMSDTHVGDR